MIHIRPTVSKEIIEKAVLEAGFGKNKTAYVNHLIAKDLRQNNIKE